MKKIIYALGFMLLCSSATFLYSCVEDDLKNSGLIFSENKNEVYFEDNLLKNLSGEENIVKLPINIPFYIEWKFTSLPDWVSVSTKSGKGSVDVEFYVKKNPSEDKNRSAKFYISVLNPDWKVNIPIEISQKVGVSIMNYSINGVTFNMKKVKAGTFTMGATSEQGSDSFEDEKPAHLVTLTHDYYIGETEVNQPLWIAVMGDNPSSYTGDNMPVNNVSWDDCQEFIGKLNSLTGNNFRLPTEAEWEYAARGGNLSQGYKYSGSNIINDVAWYDDNSDEATHPVKSKGPNELGLYDICGNLSEWCNDWYSSSYNSSSSLTNPTGSTMGLGRVLRGGNWNYESKYCRVSFRDYNASDIRSNGIGLRLVEAQPVYGSLRINLNPAVCDIYLDGEKIGSSSGNFNNIKVGVHEIKISKDGYGDYINQVKIEESQSTELSVELGNKCDYSINGVIFRMVKVQAGTFTMGATSEQGSDYFENEKPAHQVTLTHDYYIGETEVNQPLWIAVMGTNPSSYTGDNLPVEGVNWNDCQEFIDKLNSITGKNFRLPTEAEWEYAARGGNLSQGYKYSGSNNINDVAWYIDNSNSSTHPVKSKKPNELGLYDMNGNVSEICSDYYNLFSNVAQIDPTYATLGSDHLQRGGNYYFNAQCCRISYRQNYNSEIKYRNVGLRLVEAQPLN